MELPKVPPPTYTSDTWGLINIPSTIQPHVDGRDSPSTPMLVDFNRAYSEGANNHFYTTDMKEYFNYLLNLGYTHEGVACRIFDGTGEGLVPLYRLYRSAGTDHFYTMSPLDATTAIAKNGYTLEGIAGYVLPFPTKINGAIPLYKILNEGVRDHLYTTSIDERNAALDQKWKDEGVAAYVVSA